MSDIVKKINLILRLFVSAAIIFILFKLVPYQQLMAQFKNLKVSYLIYAGLLFLSLHFVGIFRWKLILRFLGVDALYKDLFYLDFSGRFFNLIFPSFIASDLFRAGFLALANRGKGHKITASVFIDRFTGALGLVLVVSLSCILSRAFIQKTSILLAIMIIWFLVGVIFLLFFSKRAFSFILMILIRRKGFREKLVKIHQAIQFFRLNPAAFIQVFGVATFIQVVTPLCFYIVGLAFGLKLPVLTYFILVPIVSVVSSIPVTVAGLGTSQAAGVFLFSQIGVDKAVSFGVFLMMSLFYILVSLLGGLLYVTFYSRRVQFNK